MHRTTFRRRRGGLVALVVAGAVTLAAVPAAVALAVGPGNAGPVTAPAVQSTAAPSSGPTAPPTPPRAASTSPVLARTVGSGWRAAPRRVTSGGVFRVEVRVSGGPRTVHLQRRSDGEWHTVARVVTKADGRAVLARRVPKHPGVLRLRVQVPRTSTSAALVTATRTVVVRRASATPPVSTKRTSPPSTRPRPRPSASAKPTPTPTSSTDSRLLTLVNHARATGRDCGGTAYPAAPPLVASAALDRAAGDYAALMVQKDFFSHNGPDGSTMVSRLNAVGIRNTAMRENIAAGQPTADAAMAAWLGSPGHCANLMAQDVHRIGLGRATGGSYRVYWVQDFAG